MIWWIETKRLRLGYKKATVNKTQPTSIRFDQQKLDFLKKRENIKSPQKIVNFLLDDYWIRHKALELVKGGNLLPLPADYQEVKNVGVLKPDGSVEPLTFNKQRLKRPFATLQALIMECNSFEEYEPLREEIEAADHLSQKEKAILLRKR